MPSRPLAAASLALLTMLAPPPSGALARSPAQPHAQNAHVERDRNTAALNITFPGGTLAQFVDALKAGAPGPLNILLKREAPSLEVPPMDLKSVSIKTALELAIPEQGRRVETLPDGAEILRFCEFSVIGEHDPSSAPVYVIDAFSTRREPKLPQRTKAGYAHALEVYSVERIVSGEDDVRRLITAINSALALSPGAQPAELKFHPEAALIIARGDPEQLSAIERVINSFIDTASIRENERIANAVQRAELRDELIERRAELEKAEAQVYMHARDLDELRKLATEDFTSQREILEAETRLRLHESEMNAARARLEATREKMNLLSASPTPNDAQARVYDLGGSAAARRLAIKVFQELDTISDHINAVHSAKNDRGLRVASVVADDAGHRALSVITQAIRHASLWNDPAHADDAWGWTREFWDTTFDHEQVP